MDNNSQMTSPEHAPRVMTRDHADRIRSRSTSQTHLHNRYAGFNFGPAILRHRTRSITSQNPSLAPASSWRDIYDTHNTSVAVAATSPRITNADTATRKFSLSGPSILGTLIANQPYVDTGYAQLNPAYDQSANVRPVWGLAKPLPHILRPGMVPTKDEIEKEAVEEGETHRTTTVDLEPSRIENTLRPDRINPQLDSIRRERELSLIRTYQHHHQDSPGFSPFGVARRPSETPTETPRVQIRHEDVIEEEPTGLEQEPPHLELPESITSIKEASEQDEVETPYEDAIPLPAYQAEDDEIHNLHTYWSIIRLRLREPLAELLAIMVQYILGFSANLSMTVSHGSAGVNDTATWAWGFATMLAIYIAGGISGAHLNPAISIMLSIYRGFPLGKLPVYIAAHMIGAFLATLIAFGIFQPGLLTFPSADRQKLYLQVQNPSDAKSLSSSSESFASIVLSNFITAPHAPWIDMSTAFLTELTGTTILTISVLALGDDTNAPPGAGMNAFIVGLLVTVLGMAFGYNTGLAMNPARDFGPRLAMLVLGYGTHNTLFANGYWFRVAWLGPLTGAILGGFLYDAAIFVGGESPVNYPTQRMRRAVRKWQEGWKMRMRQTRKTVIDIKNDVTGGGYEPVETQTC